MAADVNKSFETPLPDPAVRPDAERLRKTVQPDEAPYRPYTQQRLPVGDTPPYRPYAEKPVLPELPYKPYPKKSTLSEPPYEPYKGL
jgi:hypothetical protein